MENPAVERNRDSDRFLERMTVGMLTCHLGRQLVRAAEILPVPATDPPIDESADHYRRATWLLTDSLDDPANDRTRDESEAAAGFDAMVRRCREAFDQVDDLLRSNRAQATVAIPWQGWSLRRDDFLLTRLVEIVVHADDLARSIDVATPPFPRRRSHRCSTFSQIWPRNVTVRLGWSAR
ncbi:maleylpyruvate isomerase N-terminal domain-containing protein [Prauserella halophila]|uniref:maleylpyruvate isomerase N-terminal domain-containing protein n=1 Tax=Prauserella halophila TaxID=185641 RepID=UPI0020A552E1|nr:maleylpyruvate isomerase N-terminal domain-containing protein [Prauserella halophila]